MANETSWQILFVDDDSTICGQVKEYLEGEEGATPGDRLRVETLKDFASALHRLEVHRFDLLILDVRLGSYDKMPEEPEEEAGVKTLEAVRQTRFVPVVFYTAVPRQVQHLETPLIRVVEKTQQLSHLLEQVRSIFATGVPAVNRALVRHLERIQRDYMWEFVAKHWGQWSDASDRTELAYLLARRLAMSLSISGIDQLAQDLGNSTGRTTVVEGCVHPIQYYVMPPVVSGHLAGDLYNGKIEDQTGYWVLLTPSCDLVAGREKAEWVLLAYCGLLTEQPEYQKWQEKPSSKNPRRLQNLLRNNRQDGQRERFYFLPGVFDVPDLVVDFQQLVTVPRSQMDCLERLASLDSPFGEALLTRFVRHFGRLGAPDLDVQVVLNRLGSVAAGDL